MSLASKNRRLVVLAALALGAASGASGQAGVPETDPQLVQKLASGDVKGLDFSEGGRRDMLAVMKAYMDAGCTYQPQKGDPPSSTDFASLMNHLMPRSTEGMLLMPLLVTHPAYLRVGGLVGTQGCDAKAPQAILGTLIRALRTAPPPVVAAPPPPRPKYDNAPPSSAGHVLSHQRVDPWWKATGAFNPGGRFEQMLAETRVLVCDYRSASAPHPEGRYAWFDPPPPDLSALRRLGRGHPVGEIGPLRLENCPKALSEFDQARRSAGGVAR